MCSNTKYFKKLDLSFSDLNLVKKDIIDRYGLYKNNQFLGISYSKFDLQNENSQSELDKVLQIIPQSERDKFNASCMSINHDIYPHIDNGVNTTINMYINSCGYKTTYHEQKRDAVNYRNIFGRTSGYDHPEDKQKVLLFEDVDEICSFEAKDGDIYILNVNELHSITGGTGERMAICIQTKLPFDEVLDIIGEVE